MRIFLLFFFFFLGIGDTAQATNTPYVHMEPNTVTFSSDDWLNPHRIKIMSNDNEFKNNPEPAQFLITHEISSDDPRYNSITSSGRPEVEVSAYDNDAASCILIDLINQVTEGMELDFQVIFAVREACFATP